MLSQVRSSSKLYTNKKIEPIITDTINCSITRRILDINVAKMAYDK